VYVAKRSAGTQLGKTIVFGNPFSIPMHRTVEGKPVYVIRARKHVIAALRNTLQELEKTVPPNTNQASFSELKRILRERIADLEAGKAVDSLPLGLPAAKLVRDN
jgi:hypothetical protein